MRFGLTEKILLLYIYDILQCLVLRGSSVINQTGLRSPCPCSGSRPTQPTGSYSNTGSPPTSSSPTTLTVPTSRRRASRCQTLPPQQIYSVGTWLIAELSGIYRFSLVFSYFSFTDTQKRCICLSGRTSNH